MADNRQAIKFYAFGSKTLVELLNREVPPFARTKMPFRQLQYVEAYVAALKCATVVVESHYIDRDHIEDHGAFYSRNFISYPNYCTRLHFFSLEAADLKQRMRAAVEVGQKGVAAYRDPSATFPPIQAVSIPLQHLKSSETGFFLFPAF